MTRQLLPEPDDTTQSAAIPRTALLIPLRGADPRLAGSLTRLMQQDHPDYEIFIAVDSPNDPSWQVVQQAIDASQAQHVHVCTLHEPLQTCTLKCSALLQLAAQIDSTFRVVAMADADLVAHPSWLRELVAPLGEKTIGATYGNRWYTPNHPSIGALTRHLWNSVGVVIMTLTDAAWGGSLAVKTELLHLSDGILDKWSTALCDDLVVRNEVLRQKLRVQFVPSLMMANREDCTLRFALGFMKRQLMNTRSAVGSQWWAIIAATVIAIGLPVVAIIVLVIAVATANFVAAIWSAVGVVLFLFTLSVSWFVLEKTVRHVIQAQGQAVAPISWRYLYKLPAALICTAVVHLQALVAATWHSEVQWRGITYELTRSGDVRLQQYRPFSSAPNGNPADASL